MTVTYSFAVQISHVTVVVDDVCPLESVLNTRLFRLPGFAYIRDLFHDDTGACTMYNVRARAKLGK